MYHQTVVFICHKKESYFSIFNLVCSRIWLWFDQVMKEIAGQLKSGDFFA
jgi:hypothetical protein